MILTEIYVKLQKISIYHYYYVFAYVKHIPKCFKISLQVSPPEKPEMSKSGGIPVGNRTDVVLRAFWRPFFQKNSLLLQYLHF